MNEQKGQNKFLRPKKKENYRAGESDLSDQKKGE